MTFNNYRQATPQVVGTKAFDSRSCSFLKVAIVIWVSKRMGEVVVSSEDGYGMELEVMETEAVAEAEKKNQNDGSASVPSATALATSAVARWERFLPKMMLRLRVLLVEADDSTRQIIAALLRKCSYRVAAVSDGLKAWEILKGRPHNIDLILTEVDLPSISGFALLTLIMEHEICKNVPVIMMSTQDSVSTVYKCMLRGAADFLVKPLRKNELRNLWQHVWRRQASSSGALGPPDESVAQQKVEATAENNATSNYSSDYMACIQKNRESIEKGSDAQSSCTKPELDVEEADMECLQGLSHPEQNEPLSTDMDIHKHKELHNINQKVQVYGNEAQGSKEAAAIDKNRMTCGEDMSSDWEHFHTTDQDFETNHVAIPSSQEAIDLIGAFDDNLKCADRSSGSKAGINKIDSSPLLDLSLRRSHPSGSVNQVTHERHRLKHSDASAFSRYVNKTLQHSTSPSTGNQQDDHNSKFDRQFPSHTVNSNPDNRGLTISSPKGIHLAAGLPEETEIGFPSPQQRWLPAPVPVRRIRFDNLSNAYGSLMSVFCAQSGVSPMQRPGSVGHQEASFQVNSFHPLNHHTGDSQQFRSPINQTADDATEQSDNKQGHNLEPVEDRENISSATDQGANSSFCNGTVSHLPSLGCGSSGKINAVPFVSTAECGNEEAFRSHDVNSVRSVQQREAALVKFRLKRKERCFEKKVRYESRKKLAEKRPRVKGQFVRHLQNETPPANSSGYMALQ